MRKDSLFLKLLLLAVGAVFVYGVTHLLLLRFEKGDIYPPYSSFRSDPLGTKALYEGLRLLPGVDTARNVGPLERVSGLSEATVFLFGFVPSRFSTMKETSVKALEDAAAAGGRVAICFAPTDARPASPQNKPGKQEAVKKNDAGEKQGETHYARQYVDLTTRWSVATDLSADDGTEAHLTAGEKGLPARVTWYSTMVFQPGDKAWRVIYAKAGRPVLIERAWGKGSIVLSSDSFFLSNEAMKNERYPHLLTWVCGSHRRICFDETHLGISESPGIATLLRRHGLAPFFGSLILLALLFIWRQSVCFVPAREESRTTSSDAGRDYSTALTNLLRRNIPPDGVLDACLEEWKRSFMHGTQNRSGLLPRIEEIIAAEHALSKRHRNPVPAYREISKVAGPDTGMRTTRKST